MRDALVAFLTATLPVILLAVAWSAWHVTAWVIDARRVMREARRWGSPAASGTAMGSHRFHDVLEGDRANLSPVADLEPTAEVDALAARVALDVEVSVGADDRVHPAESRGGRS